jgi:hypothetical protein
VYKINSCFSYNRSRFCSTYRNKSCLVSVLLKIFSFVFIFSFSEILSQGTKPVIGVLGLDNSDGGVSEEMTGRMCDSISALIEQTDRYLVLKREFIPPVLEAQGFSISNTICSQREGLAAAGTLLSANEIIGGSVSRKNGTLSLSIQRIKIINIEQLAFEHISTSVSKEVFFSNILPRVVNELLKDVEPVTSPEPDIKPQITENSKRRFPIWTLLSGIAIAGAATGAYFYYEKNEPDKTIPSGVPLGELPARER